MLPANDKGQQASGLAAGARLTRDDDDVIKFQFGQFCGVVKIVRSDEKTQLQKSKKCHNSREYHTPKNTSARRIGLGFQLGKSQGAYAATKPRRDLSSDMGVDARISSSP